MTPRIALLILLLLPAFPFAAAHTPARAPAASLELYGTFEAMGVIATLAPGEDPNQNATASLSYRLAGGGAYQPAFPLSRVAAGRFVGSLFWLTPGTAYDVQVTFADPDGGALDGVTLQASGNTRAEISLPTATHTYTVSPSGGGSACTPAAPCSLAQALALAQPGEEIVLRGGVYYAGDFSPPRSGLTGAPIVIRAQSGETPILDGGDPADFQWTAVGGGVYQTTVNEPDPHLLTAGGQRLMPYTSLADVQNLAWGVAGFYAQGTTVYAHLSGNADPNQQPIVVSRFNTAFTVEVDHIYFSGLTFRHYGLGDYAKAIYFFNASDNVVQNCVFAINDLSVGVKYDSHRNVIQDNTFYDTIFDWPWDAFYAGIELSSGGVRFYSPTSGRGNVIRRNTFHDYFDGFGACPDETGGETNETDVYANTVYRAGDDGMETDGTCSNVRIWGNTFHDVLMGVSLAPTYVGPVYAMRNLIYRTGVGNNEYSGSPFKFNSGYDASGPMYLFHNTADAALPGNNGLYIKAPGSWALITARNNIWAGTEYALENYNADEPTDFDYDDFWTTWASGLVRWDGVTYPGLAGFAAAVGQEAHGMDSAPGFRFPATGDYALDAASPLINAGLHIPGINDDYAGSAPDVGAFEVRNEAPHVRVYLPAILHWLVGLVR